MLAEIRLKLKKGTHKTSVNVRLSESLMVPMCVTDALAPFGKFTWVETMTVIVVKIDEQLIMWSVALASTIQVLFFWFECAIMLTKKEKKNLGLKVEV